MEAEYVILLVIFILLAAIVVFMIAGTILYEHRGWLKFWFHDILGWHIPDQHYNLNGINLESRCRYCHRLICMDSQGGWFAYGDYRADDEGDDNDDQEG